MPRKRIIDPEFWSDEEIGQWSYEARLFYIGLWNFADDVGRFKAHPQLLKSQIFPYDPKFNIENLKKELNHKVQWYEVNGLQYGHVRNFNKHQRIDKPSDSKLPKPPAFVESSTNPLGTLPPKLIEVKLSKDNISKDTASPVSLKLQDLLKEMNYDFNIYALINKLKKDLKWAAGTQFPDEVLIGVCEQYLKDKGKIKEAWPWFVSVIKAESAKYYADQAIQQGEAWKREPVAKSMKDIMKGII